MSVNLEKIIEDNVIKAIEDEYERTRKILSEKISVTEAIGCLRKAYFVRTSNEKRTPTWSTSALIGTYIHGIVEQYFKKNFDGYYVETEVTFENEDLIGTVDILMTDKKTFDRYVVDLKTATRIPEYPFDNHIDQVNTYLYLADAKRGYIVYIDKRFTKSNVLNTKHVRAFPVVFHHDKVCENLYRHWDRYMRVVNRAKALKRYLITNTVPPREWTFECKTCEYVDYCVE